MFQPELNKDAFLNVPTLETKRVILKKISSSHLQRIFEIFSSPEIMKLRGAPGMKSVEEAKKWISDSENELKDYSGIRWGVFADEELAGTISIRKINSRHFSGELAYEILPQYRNKGLMTECLEKITEYAFSVIGLHTLSANIANQNSASKRVLEKTGFRKEAHFKENFYFEGFWDSVIYCKVNPGHPPCRNLNDL